jgi:hypothetical protein
MDRRIHRNIFYFPIYTFGRAPDTPVPLAVLITEKPAVKLFILP